MGIKANLDPTWTRVIIIAVLLTLKDILMGFLVYTKAGTFPEPAEACTILLSAVMTLVIFLLAFLQTGQIPEEE